jgi:secreted PhoX family phosphatase
MSVAADAGAVRTYNRITELGKCFIQPNGQSQDVFEGRMNSRTAATIYISGNRDTIEIDDELMAKAMQAGPYTTKKDAVEAGLKLLARQAAQGGTPILLTGPSGRGKSFQIAAAFYRGIEFAGACFDPTGRVLFASIQTPGITYAITGPWARGNL